MSQPSFYERAMYKAVAEFFLRELPLRTTLLRQVLSNRILLQYPRWHWLTPIIDGLGKRPDFPGSCGAVLKPDSNWAARYTDW
jgi:hypothetical protein